MKYLDKVREMERHFKDYSVQHIPRDDNNKAEKLAKAAAKKMQCLMTCSSKSPKNRLSKNQSRKS
jgi:hypothetical protein